MAAGFTSAKSPKWVVDRIESWAAVLENIETLELLTVSQGELPKGALPGDALFLRDSRWQKDDAETKKRAERINERFARIKARSG